MRITDNHVRDFNAYRRFRHERDSTGADFCPNPVPRLARGRGVESLSSVQCFAALETHGKLPDGKLPRQPRVLQAVMEGKVLLNLHIRMWAEGYWDCGWGAFLNELRADFPYLPEWTWDAVQGQAHRYNTTRSGEPGLGMIVAHWNCWRRTQDLPVLPPEQWPEFNVYKDLAAMRRAGVVRAMTAKIGART